MSCTAVVKLYMKSELMAFTGFLFMVRVATPAVKQQYKYYIIYYINESDILVGNVAILGSLFTTSHLATSIFTE